MNKLQMQIGDTDRVFFVGDIHGEITKLNSKLEEIGFDKELDTLISVGDLIDRGEDSLSCLSLIQEPWFKCVRGNHEDLMTNALVNKSENHLACWIQNGAQWYFNLNQEDKMYANDLAKMIKSEIPYVIELHHKGKKVVVCHADYPEDEYTGNIETECLFDIVWNRSRIENYHRTGVLSEIKGADLFVFGHTPLRKPLIKGNCAYLDTGAVFGKELMVLSFDELFDIKEE
ncbi:putative NinI protein [Vibrio phage 277E43-1]|nr:putative NinI protein [Vibrio phage 277E43-1]